MGAYSGMRKRTSYRAAKAADAADGDKPVIMDGHLPQRKDKNHPVWQAMLAGTHADAAQAEQIFVYVFAITGSATSAYRAAGYPLTDIHGNPITDATIGNRARRLVKLERVRKAVDEMRRKLREQATAEWDRDEILNGYRKLYDVALKHLETQIVDDEGNEIVAKYNERAATNAATILERITNIYGFNAPAKTDSTIRFVFNGGEAGESAGQLERGKQYDYEVEPDTDLSDFAK